VTSTLNPIVPPQTVYPVPGQQFILDLNGTIQLQPGVIGASGATTALPIPWTWWHGESGYGSEEISFGPDGMHAGCIIIIRWIDLFVAIQALLGYSYRDTSALNTSGVGSTGLSVLRRVIPWQHPLYNQLYCTRIVKFEGMEPIGNTGQPNKIGPTLAPTTAGPYPVYNYAKLYLEFTRPPYPVLCDSYIQDANGFQQEWLRYTDRNWDKSVETLNKPGQTFKYTDGLAAVRGASYNYSFSSRLVKFLVKRRWYQIPQEAVYDGATELPVNIGFDDNLTDAQAIACQGPGGTGRLGCILQTVNSNVDNNGNPLPFFGGVAQCYRYVDFKVHQRPLQLPPELMGLTYIANGISNEYRYNQQQVDVEFFFEYFQPPPGKNATVFGHNCRPWSDGRWYRVQSLVQPATTPPIYNYEFPPWNLYNLWQIL
jgi:hypothetical protein